MIINTALKTVAPFVPVAGSAYGFARTCIKVYNATSPTKALVAGVKGIRNSIRLLSFSFTGGFINLVKY
jgi:hypothetical protein